MMLAVWHDLCLCNYKQLQNMSRFYIIAGLFGCITLSPLSAQTVMSLRECMQFAVSNATKVRIQKAAIGDAQIARRDAALALFTPQVSASTSAYYNFGRSIDPQTNTYNNSTSFHNSYGVSAGYDLFDGFQAVNNYRISKVAVWMAQTEEKQVEADICLAVMQAYYNVVYYCRLSDVYKAQVQVAEAAVAKARRQEQLGQKGHADVVQMEADLADRQYELTNTLSTLQTEQIILQDLMFWPMSDTLVIDTVLPEYEDVLLPARSVVDYALENTPTVQVASYKKLNARRELSTAKWQLLPTLSLYAGWNTSYFTHSGVEPASFANQFVNNGGEYVQLTLSLPVWNRLGRLSRISKKKHALQRASAEWEQQRRDVESEVRRAVRDRDGSAAAYRQAQYKARVQAEAYALSIRKMEQGLVSPMEFQTANNNYLKSRADEMYSLLTFLIKQAVVRYYAGTNYIDQLIR